MGYDSTAESWLTKSLSITAKFSSKRQDSLNFIHKPASRSYRYLARRIFTDLNSNEWTPLVLLSGGCRPALMSETAMMLAACYSAETGQRVILVDGTLSSDGGGLAERLGAGDSAGLSELLRGEVVGVATLIRPTALANVAFLPGGRHSAEPVLIARERIVEVIAALRNAADLVVLIQGSIGSDSRYLQFAEDADLTLLTVEETQSRFDQIDEAERLFAAHGIDNVKVLLSEPPAKRGRG